jgi:hypothetical protein
MLTGFIHIFTLHPFLFRWRSVTCLAVNLITEFSKTSAFFIHSFSEEGSVTCLAVYRQQISSDICTLSTILFRRSVASRYSVHSVNVTSTLFIRTLHPPFSGEEQWPRGNLLTELISLPFFWRRNSSLSCEVPFTSTLFIHICSFLHPFVLCFLNWKEIFRSAIESTSGFHT